MKVKIGGYKHYIGPYQIADKIFFWVEKYPLDNTKETRWDYILHDKFGDWLAGRNEKDDNYLVRFCEWVQSKRKRNIKVKIDEWDTWGADHTLALIIYPLLLKVRDDKHGAPFVEDCDVPDGIGLRSTEALPKENEYDTDSNHFKRWDWVLDEMIWAFEMLNKDDDGEGQFWEEQPELDMTKYPEDEGKNVVPVRWKAEGKCDWDAMKAHNDRIQNGLILFGKYFRSLWT